MTKQFEQQCQQHDWLYEYSDSFESPKFNRGKKEEEELLEAIQKKPELRIIYDKHKPF